MQFFRYECRYKYREERGVRLKEGGGCHPRVEVSYDYQYYRIRKNPDSKGKVWHQHACTDPTKKEYKTIVMLHDPETFKLPKDYKKSMTQDQKEKLKSAEKESEEIYLQIRDFAKASAVDLNYFQ